MTLDTYSHVAPSLQREATERLDRLSRAGRAGAERAESESGSIDESFGCRCVPWISSPNGPNRSDGSHQRPVIPRRTNYENRQGAKLAL